MLTRNSQYYWTKNHYFCEEKMGMIQEYLTTEISMTQMVKKYTSDGALFHREEIERRYRA